MEDERRFATLLARRLEATGFRTTIAFDGRDGLDRAMNGRWDVAVVDVMLPGLDGITITRALRDQGSQVPVLILTARDAVEDRVRGLRAGADDYLVKPFAFVELLARLEALVRRTIRSDRLSHGPLEMDVAAHLVRVDGRPVELTGKEFDLLECLLRGKGRVLPRSEIKEYVWGFTFDAPTKVVDLYVHYLRRKLASAGAPDLVETVRGIGYSVGR